MFSVSVAVETSTEQLVNFKMKLRSVVVCFAFLVTGFECSRILILYPTLSKSHIIPLQTLSLALADSGHDITFVTTYPPGNQVKNYREIKIPFDEVDKEFISDIAKDPKGKGMIFILPKLLSLMQRLQNDTMQLKEMKKLMKEESFDLVIVGFFAHTEIMLGVADHFKCPSILFSPAGTFSVINQAMGNPLAVSGTPHLLEGVKTMDFVGRLKTFLATSVELVVVQFLKYKSREIYK